MSSHIDLVGILFVLWGLLTALVGLSTLALGIGAVALIASGAPGSGGQFAAGITAAAFTALALIAILPQWLTGGFRVAPIPFIGERLDAILPKFITEGMNVTFFFGGTSLLIVVGVCMDTVQQVESQLIMRHYDGFMKKTRLRGRRG